MATPDPGRVAVFPFRVTTADSLLGEGVAELVAGELTGESGPKAVHMGTTLRVWRRAGGGLRAPLDQPAEMRVYREYLDLRRFADSVLLPQRDSVRTELARLEAVKR